VTRRRAIWIVTAAAIVGSIVWVLWPSSEQPYLDMVASLRAAGEPVDFEGLIAQDVPAEGDDGGTDLVEGWKWVDDHVDSRRWDQVVGSWNINCAKDWPETSTREQIAELAAFLGEIEPYLVHVRAAARKARIRFRQGVRDEFGFPKTGAIRRLQQSCWALIAVAVASPDEAMRIEALGDAAAIAARTECVMWFDHVTASTYHVAVARETGRQVESGRLDPAAARARLDPLLRERWLDRAPAALRSHRAFVIQCYRTVLDGTCPYAGPTLWQRLQRLATTGKFPGPYDGPFNPGHAKEIVAYCDALSEALHVPHGRYRDYRSSLESSTWPESELEGPDTFARAAEMLTRADAAAALARVALAAAEFRATRGDYPASLDDLKPMFADGVPLDPFTDAPFVFGHSEGEIRIRSAGGPPEKPEAFDAKLRDDGLFWTLKR
jgi:hypothetical protein